MLREMLRRDFGIDVPISGGPGQTVDAPIVLDTPSAAHASWVTMEVARCLYAALGWHWRLVDRVPVPGPRAIEKFCCEVRYPQGREVITERRSLYFDLERVDRAGAPILPDCSVPLGDGTAVRLPYQLAWLHFDGWVDPGGFAAGREVGLRFAAPATKATAFVYGQGPGGDAERLTREFESAAQDLLTVNPAAKLQVARSLPNLEFAAFDIGGAYSILILSTLDGQFFKLRATLNPADEKFAFDCLWNSVNYLLSTILPLAPGTGATAH